MSNSANKKTNRHLNSNLNNHGYQVDHNKTQNNDRIKQETYENHPESLGEFHNSNSLNGENKHDLTDLEKSLVLAIHSDRNEKQDYVFPSISSSRESHFPFISVVGAQDDNDPSKENDSQKVKRMSGNSSFGSNTSFLSIDSISPKLENGSPRQYLSLSHAIPNRDNNNTINKIHGSNIEINSNTDLDSPIENLLLTIPKNESTFIDKSYDFIEDSPSVSVGANSIQSHDKSLGKPIIELVVDCDEIERTELNDNSSIDESTSDIKIRTPAETPTFENSRNTPVDEVVRNYPSRQYSTPMKVDSIKAESKISSPISTIYKPTQYYQSPIVIKNHTRKLNASPKKRRQIQSIRTHNPNRKWMHMEQARNYENENKMNYLQIITHDMEEDLLQRKKREKARKEKQLHSDVEKYFLPLIKKKVVRSQNDESKTDIEDIILNRKNKQAPASKNLHSILKSEYKEEQNNTIYSTSTSLRNDKSKNSTKKSLRASFMGSPVNTSQILIQEINKLEVSQDKWIRNRSSFSPNHNHSTLSNFYSSPDPQSSRFTKKSLTPSKKSIRVLDFDEIMNNSYHINPWKAPPTHSPISKQLTIENSIIEQETLQRDNIAEPIDDEVDDMKHDFQNTCSFPSSLLWNEQCILNLCRPLYIKPHPLYHSPARTFPNEIIVIHIIQQLNLCIKMLHQSQKSPSRDSGNLHPVHFQSEMHLKSIMDYVLPFNMFSNCRSVINPDIVPLQQQIPEIPRETIRSTMNHFNDYMTKAYTFQRANQRFDEALSLLNASILMDNIRKYEKASQSYEKVLKISQKISDQTLECVTLNYLSLNYLMRYLEEESENEVLWENAQRYAEMFLDLTDRQGKSIAHYNIAILFMVAYCKNLDHSVEMIQECLDHFVQGLIHSHNSQQPEVQQAILVNLALVFVNGNYFSESMDILQFLMRIDQSHLNKSITNLLCGHISQLIGNVEDALQYYQLSSSEGKYLSNAFVKEIVNTAQIHMVQAKSNILFESHMKSLVIQ